MDSSPKTHKSEVAESASKLLKAIESASKNLNTADRSKCIVTGIKIGELIEKILPKIK